MKFVSILMALLLCVSSFASVANGGPNPIKRLVECHLVDATTGEALTGVQVSVDGSMTLWSDEEGKVVIELPVDNESTILCSLVSFETRSLETSELQSGSIIYLSEK
jgi:hypothetical protein